MSTPEITISVFQASLIRSVVENEPLDQSLREFGFSERDVFKHFLAPHSSEGAVDYVRELLASIYEKTPRDEGKDLYVVKKIICPPDWFKGMAKAVSEKVDKKNEDKFQVLRLISADPQLIGYTQPAPGMEFYFAQGTDALDALKRTSAKEPFVGYYLTLFDDDRRVGRLVDNVRRIDRQVNNLLSNPNVKNIDKLQQLIKTAY